MAWTLPSTSTSSQATPASLILSLEATSPSAQNIFPPPFGLASPFYFPGLTLNTISARPSLTKLPSTPHTWPTPILIQHFANWLCSNYFSAYVCLLNTLSIAETEVPLRQGPCAQCLAQIKSSVDTPWLDEWLMILIPTWDNAVSWLSQMPSDLYGHQL